MSFVISKGQLLRKIHDNDIPKVEQFCNCCIVAVVRAPICSRPTSLNLELSRNLLTYLLTCFLTYLLTYLLTCLNLSCKLLTYLLAYFLTCLLTYLLTYLLTPWSRVLTPRSSSGREISHFLWNSKFHYRIHIIQFFSSHLSILFIQMLVMIVTC